MITVANTELTNTFDYWRNRTNELAHALSTAVVTTDANSGSTYATGNGGITGTFYANNLIVNNTITVKTITIGNASISTNSISVGNSTVNAVINSTSFKLSNPTANIAVVAPSANQVASGKYFLNANGSYAVAFNDQLKVNTDITTTGTSFQTIDTFDRNQFRSADYMVYVSDNLANNHYATKILVMTDGTLAHITNYGALTSNSNIGSFSATVSGNNVALMFSPTSSSTSVRVSRITI